MKDKKEMYLVNLFEDDLELYAYLIEKNEFDLIVGRIQDETLKQNTVDKIWSQLGEGEKSNFESKEDYYNELLEAGDANERAMHILPDYKDHLDSFEDVFSYVENHHIRVVETRNYNWL